MKRNALLLICSLMLNSFIFNSSFAETNSFKVGDTVFVAFPAANVRDDAFIIGLIKKIIPKDKKIQIKVMDYVEGHDYGISCTPMAIEFDGVESESKGWEMWDDTNKLGKDGVEYTVPASKVFHLSKGQHTFITRNNVLTTYSRWKSNAPMLSVHVLEISMNEAKTVGLDGMIDALTLAQQERKAYYEGNFGRPYLPHEVVKNLPKVLKVALSKLKANNSKLYKLWRSSNHNRKSIRENTNVYFTLDAIDKIIEDASGMLYEDLSKSNSKDINNLKAALNKF